LQILGYLAAHSQADVSFTELRKETGLSSATVAKWLKELEDKQLVSHRPLGNMKLYRMEREHPLVKQMNILRTISGLLPLRDIAKRFDCKIYLYGSCARGEDTEKSDIDLFIITEEHHREIQSMVEEIRVKKRLPITMFQLQLFTSLGWAQMARKDPAFYERVEKDKIQIV